MSKKPKILVVDLDGSLLKSDLLLENLWAALNVNWVLCIWALLRFFSQPSRLKFELRNIYKIDVTTLPFDHVVIEFVLEKKRLGYKTILLSASNENYVAEIANYLKIFDEWYGSSSEINLKGNTKVDFLNKYFVSSHVAYVGDSFADLPVWACSDEVVTVNSSLYVRKRLLSVHAPQVHLETNSGTLGLFLRALRPHQWVKNSLIFLPALAGHRFDAGSMLLLLAAFVSFSMVSSSVYLMNDLLDLRVDRLHPRKRFRPLAAGSLSVWLGSVAILPLCILGFAVAAIVSTHFFVIVVVYWVFTVLYSLYFKKIVVVDVCILSVLYVLRVVAGSVAIDIDLSFWLAAFCLFLFFSLAAIKRQSELVDLQVRSETRAIGRGYNVSDLFTMTAVSLASGYVSVAVLALYINSPEVVSRYSAPQSLWGVCLVLLYWFTRLSLVTARGQMNDDPITYALTDRITHVCALLVLICVSFGVWL